MSTTNETEALKRLQQIPNVGPAIARRLAELGFDGAASLRGQDPEELLVRTQAARGTPEDPCLPRHLPRGHRLRRHRRRPTLARVLPRAAGTGPATFLSDETRTRATFALQALESRQCLDRTESPRIGR
jgi:hypothetical protein